MSEKIVIQCSQCSKRLRTTPAVQARRARCPACQAILTIPAAPTPPSNASTPEASPPNSAPPENNQPTPAPTSAPTPSVLTTASLDAGPAQHAIPDSLDFDSLADNPYRQSTPLQNAAPNPVGFAPVEADHSQASMGASAIPLWLVVALGAGSIAALALFLGGVIALWSVLSTATTTAGSPQAPRCAIQQPVWTDCQPRYGSLARMIHREELNGNEPLQDTTGLSGRFHSPGSLFQFPVLWLYFVAAGHVLNLPPLTVTPFLPRSVMERRDGIDAFDPVFRFATWASPRMRSSAVRGGGGVAFGG